MTLYGVIAFHPRVWRAWSARVPWLPRWLYQAGWLVASGSHVYKGARAGRRARAAGFPDADAWVRQTLLLGFPSDRKLNARLATVASQQRQPA
jgi:hypothetical protein